MRKAKKNFWREQPMSKIVCQWRENNNRYMVNPDGQVFQCCFLKINFDDEDYFVKGKHAWVDEYLDNKEKYNLKNRTMKEIVDDDLFAKKLPKTWVNIDTAPRPCQKYCKVKI